MKTNKLFFLIIAILTLSIASVGFAYVSEDASVSENKSTLSETQATTETKAEADDMTVNETNPFISARLVMIEEALAQLVEAGDITQDEADRVLAGLKNHIAAVDDPITDLVFGGGRGQEFRGNMRNHFLYENPGMPNQIMGRGKGFGMPGNGWAPQDNNGIQNRVRNQDGNGENCNMDCPYRQANP